MHYRSDYPAYNNCYHFTGSTKYRKNVFSELIRKRMAELIEEKVNGLGIKLHALAVAVNHVHILVESDMDPKKIAQFLFGYTSRFIRKEFPKLTDLNDKELWGGKACTNIKDEDHLSNAIQYIKRHRPDDDSVEM